ncbi:MAG TPA: DUF2293 domain-containing protein [Aurantimonas coralicida]|uniref:DUF2293 domain-containing protein n=2 Tax=root TaxID=1 RepID=A0A9C9TIY6_9HYPH|nr:DUF2293 domain-containing protein [Aurantimonas coralicida]HEU02867.1 DUF2293 domain-containing protein [Aurantimonas coralicida]
MPTDRQKRIARALTATIPRAPFVDAEAIRAAAGARHMRALSPQSAVWLATVAHIRHAHTEYDMLMDEGYDREAARFFVLDAINAMLDRWGATRRVDAEADSSEATAQDLQSGATTGRDEPYS